MPKLRLLPIFAGTGTRLRCAILLSKGTRIECSTSSIGARICVTAGSCAHSAMTRTHSCPTDVGVHMNGQTILESPGRMLATPRDDVVMGDQLPGQTSPMPGIQ